VDKKNRIIGTLRFNDKRFIPRSVHRENSLCTNFNTALPFTPISAKQFSKFHTTCYWELTAANLPAKTNYSRATPIRYWIKHG